MTYSSSPLFQSTPPSWEATVHILLFIHASPSFQSTPPSREATNGVVSRGAAPSISIHASLAGGDHCLTGDTLVCTVFQSTPPSREATVHCVFNTVPNRCISIHASLAGGDFRLLGNFCKAVDFNPRLPHGRRLRLGLRVDFHQPISIHASLAGGDDSHSSASSQSLLAFQSTPPSREATSVYSVPDRSMQYFNPRLPRGRRLLLIYLSVNICFFISIHASLAGGDRARLLPAAPMTPIFQSTPPSREATWSTPGTQYPTIEISIHASLAGGDSVVRPGLSASDMDFNPRLPRGRRPPLHTPSSRRYREFQSTPPSREATVPPAGRNRFPPSISIHASLAGGDE